MKRNIIIILGVIVTSILYVACEEQLDYTNDGRITRDEVFEDNYKIQAYLNSCYNYHMKPAIHWSSYSDEAEDSDNNLAGSGINGWYAGSATAATFGRYSFDDPWANLYEGIRRCNIFIANIKTATAFGIDDYKDGWEAQARTLRALYYLQLIQRYGGVPITSEAIEPGHDYSTAERSSFSEVVTFIINDCDSALSVPTSDILYAGFPWGVLGNQWGMMTRAVAYAIKSRAATYAASSLWADGTYTWANATAINKEALYQCLTNDYKLFDVAPNTNDFQNAYAYYFVRKSDDARAVDKETILGRGSSPAIWSIAGLPSNPGMVKAGPGPTQDLIDSYEMANGMAPISGYSDANRLVPIINAGSGYDPNNPYVGRDPRFYASIYFNGAIRSLNAPGGVKVETFIGGAEGIDETERRNTKTGYYVRKFNNWRSTISNNADGEIRIFRLAELYMNFAESAYQSDGPDVAIELGSGMTMSAREAVNAVRARAGMPPLPAGLSEADFEERYRNERRIEFAFEGQRFFDVRRWRILSSTDAFVTGMKITKDGANLTYERFKFPDRLVSSDRYLRYPIDESEVNKMLSFTGDNWQNTGW